MKFTEIKAGTFQSKRLVFGANYNASPHIVGSIIGGSGVVTTAVNLSHQFAFIDTEGATVYFYNGSSADIGQIRIHWIAIG